MSGPDQGWGNGPEPSGTPGPSDEASAFVDDGVEPQDRGVAGSWQDGVAGSSQDAAPGDSADAAQVGAPVGFPVEALDPRSGRIAPKAILLCALVWVAAVILSLAAVGAAIANLGAQVALVDTQEELSWTESKVSEAEEDLKSAEAEHDLAQKEMESVK
ncbi:hypothetical protein I6B53_09680 [Schaalia sp. 19OD2882]|uniref:hypothetical protein n=1 Tax=Schaalia sp. 19OD2882 TaxID=2794089 RepID=UPI001C1ED151|nr:hypothetical protein [Schaalia sp. 19OD2882]QWW19350.1 hypothetical protein I6B53_09680 [Schaalia sp. 19OD2882]